MLFNTAEFAVFFLIVYGLYWLLRGHRRVQNPLLLAASFLFYGWWDVRFLFLFILTTTVDFYAALMIGRGQVHWRERVVESAVLLGSAFLCVTVDWSAIEVTRTGLHLAWSVDRAALLPHALSGWLVFLGTLAVVVAVNLMHPWFTTFSEERRRRFFLVGSIVSNLTVLGFFKYFNFFAENLTFIANALLGQHLAEFTLRIVLPVGISFYTFQSLAYTIDVYRRKVPPVDHYVTLAACLSFFPLLVAGPIVRPAQLIPQFLRERTVDRAMFRDGLWLVVWGLYKKMVVADNMAGIANRIFGPYDLITGPVGTPQDGLRLLVGVYAFAFQIYGDFSGYSDIARGTAKLMGFEIILNFNLPYFAVSPSDFWRRWHISLSSWLRDYLYIALGGNRGGAVSTYRNLFLTMLLGGLWHGAAWTFVLWGIYHGGLLIVYRLVAPNVGDPARHPALAQAANSLKADVGAGFALFLERIGLARGRAAAAVAAARALRPAGPRVRPLLGMAVAGFVMFHLTCLGWLLFRARNLTTVRVFLESMLTHPVASPEAIAELKHVIYFGWFLVLFQVVQATTGSLDPSKRWPWFARYTLWLYLLLSLLVLASQVRQEFIYFAF